VSAADPLRFLFARNLRAARKHQRLTQEDLADLSGLHPTYISDIERGERNVSIDNIGRLATALQVDAATLLSGPLTTAQ
jgi:transcriptional regulator with XRE-family HTH domain